MNITRHTKIHQLKGTSIQFRTLSLKEIAHLDTFKNETHRNIHACKLALTSHNFDDLELGQVLNVGKHALYNSTAILSDNMLFDTELDDMRESVKNDKVLSLVLTIIKTFPSESILDLLELTPKDLLELAVMCEIFGKEKIFKSNVKRTQNTSGKTEFEDDGKSLQQKIKEALAQK